MHTLTKRILPFAALLLFGAPLGSHASDLSLPLFTWSEVSKIKLPYDPRDPLVQLLSEDASEGDVWARIRSGFGIPDVNNRLVDNHIKWYVSRPDYIERTTTRASRYLFHVVQELEKRKMPMELALLPFIESAFNPYANSTAKAAGMWQFIPSTGRIYKLKQNLFTDERRDVIASTDAALTYLQNLYDRFGDWQLALAAYNWGEGSVQRAINKNRAHKRPTDFNGLSRLMPAETRNYLPKLQAVKNIISAPGNYGVTLPKVDNEPYFVTVGKTRTIDVEVAAKLAELPLEEFKALNPQFNRPVIVGSADTQILLPQSNAEIFKANLATWKRALSSWTTHRVTDPRERIEAIAEKYGTTPELIRDVNNIPPRTVLKSGSTVLVPISDLVAAKDITPELADKATLVALPDIATRRVYVKVAKGDTLSSIARRNHVTVEDIKDWNNLRSNNVGLGKRLELHVPQRAVVVKKHGKKSVRKVATPAKKKKAVATTSKNSKGVKKRTLS